MWLPDSFCWIATMIKIRPLSSFEVGQLTQMMADWKLFCSTIFTRGWTVAGDQSPAGSTCPDKLSRPATKLQWVLVQSSSKHPTVHVRVWRRWLLWFVFLFSNSKPSVLPNSTSTSQFMRPGDLHPLQENRNAEDHDERQPPAASLPSWSSRV